RSTLGQRRSSASGLDHDRRAAVGRGFGDRIDLGGTGGKWWGGAVLLGEDVAPGRRRAVRGAGRYAALGCCGGTLRAGIVVGQRGYRGEHGLVLLVGVRGGYLLDLQDLLVGLLACEQRGAASGDEFVRDQNDRLDPAVGGRTQVHIDAVTVGQVGHHEQTQAHLLVETHHVELG